MPVDVHAHRFISHFPAIQGARLVRHVRLVRFPHKAVIFPEGGKSDCVYLVFTGRVMLTKKKPGGAPQFIAYKGPDDYFGELGVLDGSPRSTAATADGPVQLGRLPRKPLLQILSDSSWHTILGLFSHVSENLRATNARYVSEIVRKEKITLIGEMANSMIHDFRSPFTTIRLATESLAMRSADPKTQEFSAMILGQVDRLGGMMEEVLEFARGETRLRPKALPLQAIFDQLKQHNADELNRAGVRLVVKPSPLIALVDPSRFLRVLQNIVTNALEAFDPRQRGRITIAARRLAGHCVLTVTDNGPGIPEEIRSTLFEPFVTHGKSNGTGLGLAIARSVVEAHHGTIECRSAKIGTCFVIRLPLIS